MQKEEEKAEKESKNKPEEIAVVAVKEKKKISFKDKFDFENIEKDIEKLNSEKAAITVKMSNENISYNDMQTVAARMVEVENLIAEKEMRWLELSEMMD